MSDRLQTLNLLDSARVLEIAKELSAYNLGIFAPHTHGAAGEIIPLPAGIVAYEKNLEVSFLPKAECPADAVAVGWRWEADRLSVCANCCTRNPPG